MLGQEPRQTTSNVGHLNKPSIQVNINNIGLIWIWFVCFLQIIWSYFSFFSGSYPWAEQTLLLNCNQLQEKRAGGENVVELAQKEMDWWTNFEEVRHTLENQRADCPGVYSSFHQLYGDNFSSVGAWDLIIIFFLVTYYPQCVLSCPGNAEPSHQVQQGSARGGWAATWETCHSECGSAGCKEAFGRAYVEFDVVKHSSDPRNHAWHGCLLAYTYCCSKQSTHTHFIEAPDTWNELDARYILVLWFVYECILL